MRSQGPQEQGCTHTISLLPWPRLPHSECLPHRGQWSESAWSLRLRTDGIFCPRILAGGCGIDGAVRHSQQVNGRPSDGRGAFWTLTKTCGQLKQRSSLVLLWWKSLRRQPNEGHCPHLSFLSGRVTEFLCGMVLVTGWCGDELEVEQIFSADF